MKNIQSLVLISCLTLVSGCSNANTAQEEVAAEPKQPNPVCVEEAKMLSKKCTGNLSVFNMDELYRCHVLVTTPDSFKQRCEDISLPNAAALFILLATDSANSENFMDSSKYLKEIKSRCDNTPIKEFTIPEKEFCEESLSMNLLEFMDDIEEQVQ